MEWLWRLRRSSGGSGDGIALRAVDRNLSSAYGRSPAARECISVRSGCWLPAQDAAHPSIALREVEWNALLADIRLRYKNRPKFMELLDKLDPRPIVEQKRARR